MFRQPLGVVAAITPFNFPAMIPLWFLPYAVACGNCFILKPSERVPLTAIALFALARAGRTSPGVRATGPRRPRDGRRPARPPGRAGRQLRRLHRRSRATSTRGPTANGKRAQCQGGAKNPVVVLPDADLEMTTKIVADSAFGCAGQRCLADVDRR